MPKRPSSRRWILLLLVGVGVAVVALLPGGASDESEEAWLDGGVASRRVFENCDPLEESLEYEDFVGRRALAILSWEGMSERASNLKIPIRVVGIEDGAIGVRLMQFPMREHYVNIWIGSGHIKPGPRDVLKLDPCSATIVEWPEMERGPGSRRPN